MQVLSQRKVYNPNKKYFNINLTLSIILNIVHTHIPIIIMPTMTIKFIQTNIIVTLTFQTHKIASLFFSLKELLHSSIMHPPMLNVDSKAIVVKGLLKTS